MLRYISLLSFLLICLSSKSQNLTIYKSDKSVDETAAMITKIIKAGDLHFIEMVSHDEICMKRGIQMSPTKIILFEDPEVSALLIACQPTAAIDLPLRIIVWEENEDVYVGYMDPRLMTKRFMLASCEEYVGQLARLMIRVTTDAIRQL